jgi:hypothetical protein
MAVEEEGEKNSGQLAANIGCRRFANVGDASKELFEGFNDWSATVSSYGMHMAYALIAANWAVYGNAKAILQNTFAKISVAIVIFFLVLNLLCTWIMTRAYSKRCDYADKNKKRWSEEFEREIDLPSDWPYTKFIAKLGDFMRLISVHPGH